VCVSSVSWVSHGNFVRFECKSMERRFFKPKTGNMNLHKNILIIE
jgi:hypothetical protein